MDDPEEQEHFARYGQSQSTSTHFDSVDDPEDTSLYSVKERASASAWAKMRSFLRNTVVECSAIPSDQSCIKCPEAAVYIGVFSVDHGYITAMIALVELNSVTIILEKCGR